jgi:hypothetical protein
MYKEINTVGQAFISNPIDGALAEDLSHVRIVLKRI